MTSVGTRSEVLVVLSSEQCEARSLELARLERPGIELVFEQSPETALDLVEEIRPALVLVGMTVGGMEGLEFLALLLKRLPEFDGNVVVLPDKDDPFSPMLQARDPVTKKSTTQGIDLAGIESLVESLSLREPPAAAPGAPPRVARPEPIGIGLPDTRESWAGSSRGADHPEAQPPTPGEFGVSSRSPWSAMIERLRRPQGRGRILAAVVMGFAILTTLSLLSVRACSQASLTASPESVSDSARAPREAATSPPVETPASAVASGVENAPLPGDSSLERPTTLPLSFAKNSAEFEITNAEKLTALVEAIKGTLGTASLEVGGHTSTEGPEQFNKELAMRRAASVRHYLVGRGVPEERIVLKGFHAPTASPSSSQAANRRVTVRVLR
jgi:outer membrane protein OmpA-like peptidoglycan-associated protein/CheY-like chemotaxis protein